MSSLRQDSLETKGSRRSKANGKANGKDDTTVIVPDFEPFTAQVTAYGTAPILFHAYDIEEVERKGNLPKGAKEKKVDNVESYVYRDPKGHLCIPAINIKAAMANAAKRLKDPSSPRRSAKDLIRAGITVGPFHVPFKRNGKFIKKWDGIDRRGVVVQQSRITRSRPYLEAGWTIDFEVTVMDSEHIDENFLHDLIVRAGRFSALGDFRPDFGQFRIDSFKRIGLA